ncbi:ribonuclease H-like domain-containing protein [Tanacetum coccineum]
MDTGAYLSFGGQYSPVVKPATIRTVLSLAVSRNWPIHQLDVKNAFLHGHLSETVYMHQPPGFVDPNKPDYVCHLQRSLYGLKQAPRAWFQRFASYAKRVGFQHSKTDSSLFVFHRGSDIAYLLLYVDDIILTASSSAFLQRIIASLHNEFAMKDLGSLNYFLEFLSFDRHLAYFCSQSKFTRHFLSELICKIVTRQRTLLNRVQSMVRNVTAVSDPTLYRSLAGALQYLTFTRPDLSYVVQQVCLYMHDPRDPHFTALKRILRYVRGTLDYGLQLHVSSTYGATTASAYTDALIGLACPDLPLGPIPADIEGVANVVAETELGSVDLLCEHHTSFY